MAVSKADLVDRRTKLLANVSWLENEISQRVKKWRIAARHMGSAYSEAYKRHEDIIIQQNTYAAVTSDAAFGVLTMCTSGGFSVLSSLAKRHFKRVVRKSVSQDIDQVVARSLVEQRYLKKMAEKAEKDAKKRAEKAAEALDQRREVILEGVEDGIQSGSEAFLQIASKLSAPVANGPVSKSPMSFQNDIMNLLDNELILLEKYTNAVRKEAQDMPLSKFRKFDYRRQRNNFESFVKELERRHKVPSETEPYRRKMVKEMEYGMWAAWIKQNCKKVSYREGRGGASMSGRADRPPRMTKIVEYNDPGTKIEDHLSRGTNTLGITDLAGIGEDFGWWTTDWEVAKLVRWAQTWRPKDKFGWR